MLPAGLDMKPLLNPKIQQGQAGTSGKPQFVYGVVAGRIMVNVADESGLLFLCVVFCVVFIVFFVVGTEVPLPKILDHWCRFVFQ